MFVAAFKKEWKESVRRHRILVVIGIFLILGIISPIGAKLLPKMLEMMATKTNTQGIQLSFSREPMAGDAIFQYNKNFSMLPILIVLLAMGLVTEEKARGTAEMILSKPVSRFSFIFSKFACLALVILIGAASGGVVCLFYTSILLGGVDIGKYLFLNFLLFFYLVPFISITLFMSVVIKNIAGAAISGIGFYFFFMIVGVIPGINRFTPQGIYSYTAKMVLNSPSTEWIVPFISSLLITVVSFLLSIVIFEKQEI